jgi:uncharacterized protein YPO0396
VKQEQELQGKEEEITSKLEREHNELKSRTNDLNAREAALGMAWERLSKMHEDLCNHELAISSQEGTLERHTITLTFKGEGASRQGETASGEITPRVGCNA